MAAPCHCDKNFMRRNQVLQDLLPKGYDFRICSFQTSSDGFVAAIYMKITTEEGAKKWLKDFQQSSKTTWRKDKTYPRQTGANLYRVDLRCHHNTKPKNEMANYKLTSKNTNCPAKMNITVKKMTMRNGRKTRSKHTHIVNGYFTRVHLSFKHNHLLDSVDTYRKRDVNTKTIDKLKLLFEAGHSPASALEVIKFELQELYPDNYFMKSSDRAINPDFGFSYRLYSKVNGRSYKAPDSEHLFTELETRLKDYCSKNGETNGDDQFARVLKTDDGEICVVICTPLMYRVHRTWETSCEMVFVYASPTNAEKHNRNIFLLLTYSPIGALPLGAIVTTAGNVETLTSAFNSYKSLLRENDFYCRGESGPVLFVTDDRPALRTALNNAWPSASLFVCVIHLLHATRRWLWNQSNCIHVEHRQDLLNRLRDMLFPENDRQLDEIYSELAERWTDEYPRFVERLSGIYECRASWANNYSAPMMRVLKDRIFDRLKAFNAVQLVDVIVAHWDKDLKKTLINAANQRGRRGPKYFPIDAEIDDGAIVEIGEKRFMVPSFSHQDVVYDVDIEFGLCTCNVGCNGGPCKHQGIVIQKFDLDTSDGQPEILNFECQQFYEIATGNVEFVPDDDENEEEERTNGNDEGEGTEELDLEIDETVHVAALLQSADAVFSDIKQNLIRNPEVFLKPVERFVNTYFQDSPLAAFELVDTLVPSASNGEPSVPRSRGKRRRIDAMLDDADVKLE